jgi:hypothetical protein
MVCVQSRDCEDSKIGIPMSLPCKNNGRTGEDDGLKIRNFAYAILLMSSYVALALVIEAVVAGYN